MEAKTAALIALCISTAGPAFCYTVDATIIPEMWDFVDAIAVAPIEPCPGGIDCVDMEEEIHDELKDEYELRLVKKASEVRRALLQLNQLSLNQENRVEVARLLGVKAFLVISIPHTDKQERENYNIWVGDKWFLWEDSVNRGSVSVVMVSAPDGKLLMRGIGHGSSEFRSQKGVLTKIVTEILERTFKTNPRPPKPN